MLYDYQQNTAKALNFDLKDLDFKIQNIEKLSDIKASDSLPYIKEEFVQVWNSEPDQSLIDTLSFDYVKSKLNFVIEDTEKEREMLNKLIKSAREISESNSYEGTKLEINLREKELKVFNEQMRYVDALLKVKGIEYRYNILAKNPDSILSTKYGAKYSMNNPMLGNTKQTFERIYFTNAAQTKFIKEEKNPDKIKL